MCKGQCNVSFQGYLLAGRYGSNFRLCCQAVILLALMQHAVAIIGQEEQASHRSWVHPAPVSLTRRQATAVIGHSCHHWHCTGLRKGDVFHLSLCHFYHQTIVIMNHCLLYLRWRNTPDTGNMTALLVYIQRMAWLGLVSSIPFSGHAFCSE